MNASHLMDLALKFELKFLKNSIKFCSLIKIIEGFKSCLICRCIDYLKVLQLKFATIFHKKIIRQKGRKKIKGGKKGKNYLRESYLRKCSK